MENNCKGDYAKYVHLFVSADVKTKPEIVVKRFKSKTSKYLRRESKELLKIPF